MPNWQTPPVLFGVLKDVETEDSMGTVPIAPRGVVPRIRVFIDYWNLQLSLNALEEESSRQQNVRFKIDWRDREDVRRP